MAAAASAKKAVQVKAADVRLASAFGTLGRAAFERHGVDAGPPAITDRITKITTDVAGLDEQRKTNAAAASSNWKTPTLPSVPGWNGLPAGLRRGVRWVGGAAAALFVVLLIVVIYAATRPSYSERQLAEATAQLEQADAMWDGGDRRGAYTIYTLLIEDSWDLPSDLEHEEARLFGRVISYHIDEGRTELARPWVRKCIEREVELMDGDDATFALLREERAAHAVAMEERRQRDREYMARKRVEDAEAARLAADEREREREHERAMAQHQPEQENDSGAGSYRDASTNYDNKGSSLPGFDTKFVSRRDGDALVFTSTRGMNDKLVKLWERSNKDGANGTIMMDQLSDMLGRPIGSHESALPREPHVYLWSIGGGLYVAADSSKDDSSGVVMRLGVLRSSSGLRTAASPTREYQSSGAFDVLLLSRYEAMNRVNKHEMIEKVDEAFRRGMEEARKKGY